MLSTRVVLLQPSCVRSKRLQTRPRCRIMAAAAGPKLYSNERSRSQIISWYARETGTSYVSVELNMGAGEHKAAAYLQLHPFGKVPALECADGTPVFESGAILAYLADKYGGLDTPEKRARQSSWLVWANATLAPAMFGPSRAQQMPAMLEPLNALLSKQEWLTGAAFSVSDVAVGAYLSYTKKFFADTSYKKWPKVEAYMARIEARPHFAATIGSE